MAEANTDADEARELLEEKERKRAAIRAKNDRERFLERALDFNQTYRQCTTRVQWMRSRYKTVYHEDHPNYGLYKRSKQLLSKFEYNMRQMKLWDTKARMAQINSDVKGYDEADAKGESYMKNCLYYAFGLGQVYNQFKEGVPNGSLHKGT